MRKLLLAVAAAAVMVVPAAGSAGFTMGLRLGYAVPGGDVGGDASGTLKMSDYIGGAVPFQLDLGGTIGRNLTIGGYIGYGVGSVASDMDTACSAAGLDCSVWTLHIGAQALWNFMPLQKVDPWVGVGLGYEMLYFSAGSVGHDSCAGWEMPLQVGVDFRVGRVFAIAPFLSLGFGQYSSYDTEAFGVSGSGSIPDKKIHTWMQFGVRGNFTW